MGAARQQVGRGGISLSFREIQQAPNEEDSDEEDFDDEDFPLIFDDLSNVASEYYY